jgi:hypothetical protein
VIVEVKDDLLELCGVDPDNDPNTWLETVKRRLRSDLAQFRADVEGDYDQIEQWSLVDAGVLAAAGFERVRKAELEPA